MLRSALTCIDGCSCWSPDEENSPQSFPYHGCALPTELGGQVGASPGREPVDEPPASAGMFSRPPHQRLVSTAGRESAADSDRGGMVHGPDRCCPASPATLTMGARRGRCESLSSTLTACRTYAVRSRGSRRRS